MDRRCLWFLLFLDILLCDCYYPASNSRTQEGLPWNGRTICQSASARSTASTRSCSRGSTTLSLPSSSIGARGPDNWHRDVTAVQMLESAQRLLEIENPLGQDRPEQPVIAPSRHRLTIGQEMRGQWSRWYSSGMLRQFLKEQPNDSVGSFRFSFRNLGESWAALVHEAMPLGGTNWRDVQIPSALPEAGPGDLYTGIWFKTDLDPVNIGKPENLQVLRQVLDRWKASPLLATDGTSPVDGFQRSIAGVLNYHNT